MKKKYKPDKVIHIGDEIDGNSISMHPHSPNLMSPSDDLQSAIEKLHQGMHEDVGSGAKPQHPRHVIPGHRVYLFDYL